MGKKNQCQLIIEYLDKYQRITVRDINIKLHINGATARISDLRRDGYNIHDVFEQVGRHRYKVYFRGADVYNNFIDPQLKKMAEDSNEFIKE